MEQDRSDGFSYVLGLDQGVSSIGWAVVRLGLDGRPDRVVALGTHLFEAGVDAGKNTPEDALASGREASKATPRRQARQQRRQTWRRAARKRKLLRTLQKHGLLPAGDTRDGAAIDGYMKSLDAELRDKWEREADHRDRQLLPYRLRAAAIEQALEPFEVGRALYHLAQRRGFLSNRKTDRDDEDAGKVRQGIEDLASAIDKSGMRTLGAYFATLDPTALDAKRIRQRWTSRAMYEYEFDEIWRTQASYHAGLMTDEARQAVHAAIFFQRPLKSQRHLIGRCDLVPGKRRCAIADRGYQRLRLLQKVNDLEILDRETGEERRLSDNERAKLVATLGEGDVTFAAMRKKAALNLPKKRYEFNLERGGEKRLAGHRTDEKLRGVFGEARWAKLTEQEKNALVEDVLTIDHPESLARRGRERWGLPADAAILLSKVRLEQGYGPLSRIAILRLLPHLEQGTRLQTARKEVFPGSFQAVEPIDLLPPVVATGDGKGLRAGAFRDPPSPAVTRGLSEARKVVNAVIRRWGKPERIHLEMARDLKKGRKRREDAAKSMRDREKEREDAKARLLRDASIEHPSREDIEKVLLADECGWTCPFTGESFGMRELVGPTPSVDVEHIWPFRRSLDNTFLNKTLCLHEENRNRKRDNTPCEAYSGDPERYAAILQRVAAFKGNAKREKLRRFAAEAMDEGFTERHLAETRYVSRKAAEYFGLLYGGLSDADGNLRVRVCTGGLTAWLRRSWGIDGIVGSPVEGGAKPRDDHRHHAIDALIVALSDGRAVQALSRAAQQADESGYGRLFAAMKRPWDSFEQEARQAVEQITVSHRVDRRVSGALHKDTVYSHPIQQNGQRGHRLRKELHKLSANEIELIADERVRCAVRDALEASGVTDPSKAFADPASLPLLKISEDGAGLRRIRSVRLQRSERPRPFGEAPHRRRYVAPQSNHHTVILARVGPDGRDAEWRDEPVPMYIAYERVRRGLPVVDTSPRDDDWQFRFSLVTNDYIEMDQKDGQGRAVFRVLNISQGDMELRRHDDGRTRQAIRKGGERPERVSGSSLLRRNGRKVRVSHLGEIINAGG